jgi:hypothetical protein
MYREARTAGEAKTGMEASHHLTSTLYFGISALEAFLNQRMRVHLKGMPEEEVFETLAKGKIADKIKKWPKQILGRRLDLRKGTQAKLFLYNEVRGALTHPKHPDHRDYEPLEELDPMEVVDTVAEYIAQFLDAAGEPFHYWLWGWNYLSPSKDGHQIALLFESQMVHSMRALGFPRTPGFPLHASLSDAWQKTHMRGYAAYANVAKFLEGLDHCEPKHPEFPYQPKLCRRWWDPEHHATCGHVTPEAIRFAVEYNPFEEARTKAAIEEHLHMSRIQRLGKVLRFFVTGK